MKDSIVSLEDYLFQYSNLLNEDIKFLLSEKLRTFQNNKVINEFVYDFDFIHNIISSLKINEEIKMVKIYNDLCLPNGYYNNKEKLLVLNFKLLCISINKKIISNEIFLIEYLTMIMHECFHAIQYKSLNLSQDNTTSITKRLSNIIKNNNLIGINYYPLIPDEREASIISANIIFDFFRNTRDSENIYLSESYKNLIYYLKIGYSDNTSPYDKLLFLDNNLPNLTSEDKKIKLLYGLKL